MKEDGVVILDTRATANLVCFRWLNHHTSALGRTGLPRVPAYPAPARFKFGGGGMGDVRFAANNSRYCRSQRPFTAFILDADTPAFFRERALEPLGGQLGLSRNTLTLGLRGVEISFKVNCECFRGGSRIAQCSHSESRAELGAFGSPVV